MTDQPTRAEWWREVTDLDEVIPAGCPVRTEYSGLNTTSNSEHEPKYSSARGSYSAPRLFIDSRWQPASKVGDVIETVEELERLPVGAGVVDYREEIAIKRCEQRWNYANLNSESCGSESIMGLAPITVIYVPEAGGSDD